MKKVFCAVLILVVIIGSAVAIERVVYPFEYRNEIERSTAEVGLAPALIASLICAESRYRPRVVSSKGAVGLMQLLPSTAAEQAEALGVDGFDIYAPAINIRLGCHYFSGLLARFGHVREALAAYNAGAKRVDEWLANPAMGKNGRLHTIPYRETRAYCDRIERNQIHYARKFR